jgi:hypothetical protein
VLVLLCFFSRNPSTSRCLGRMSCTPPIVVNFLKHEELLPTGYKSRGCISRLKFAGPLAAISVFDLQDAPSGPIFLDSSGASRADFSNTDRKRVVTSP